MNNLIKKLQIFKNVEGFDRLYLAGGAVRDLLLGYDVKDYDFVIDGDLNAGLEFAINAAKHLGVYKEGSNPVTYPKYGTAKLAYKGEDYEFVAPRSEKYEEGSRNPEVFSTSLEQDSYRRDLTINSLFLHIKSEEILDFTSLGLKDIHNKMIRTPLDPNITFSDDPLRMLRFVRFLFKYDGWWYDHEAFDAIRNNAIRNNAIKIKTISSERINEEFSKILLSDKIDEVIKFLLESFLLDAILPELTQCLLVTQNDHHNSCVFGHTVSVVSKTPKDLVARLGALFHDIGKPATKTEEDGKVHFYRHEEVGAEIAEKVLRRLKYPNKTVDKVVKIVSNHMQLKYAGDEAKVTDKALRKFVVRNEDVLDELLDVMHADNISYAESSNMPNQIPLIREKIKKLEIARQKPNLPISGKDLIGLGLTPSPLFSKLLEMVEEAWYSNPDISREEALGLVKKEIN